MENNELNFDFLDNNFMFNGIKSEIITALKSDDRIIENIIINIAKIIKKEKDGKYTSDANFQGNVQKLSNDMIVFRLFGKKFQASRSYYIAQKVVEEYIKHIKKTKKNITDEISTTNTSKAEIDNNQSNELTIVKSKILEKIKNSIGIISYSNLAEIETFIDKKKLINDGFSNLNIDHLKLILEIISIDNDSLDETYMINLINRLSEMFLLHRLDDDGNNSILKNIILYKLDSYGVMKSFQIDSDYFITDLNKGFSTAIEDPNKHATENRGIDPNDLNNRDLRDLNFDFLKVKTSFRIDNESKKQFRKNILTREVSFYPVIERNNIQHEIKFNIPLDLSIIEGENKYLSALSLLKFGVIFKKIDLIKNEDEFNEYTKEVKDMESSAEVDGLNIEIMNKIIKYNREVYFSQKCVYYILNNFDKEDLKYFNDQLLPLNHEELYEFLKVIKDSGLTLKEVFEQSESSRLIQNTNFPELSNSESSEYKVMIADYEKRIGLLNHLASLCTSFESCVKLQQFSNKILAYFSEKEGKNKLSYLDLTSDNNEYNNNSNNLDSYSKSLENELEKAIPRGWQVLAETMPNSSKGANNANWIKYEGIELHRNFSWNNVNINQLKRTLQLRMGETVNTQTVDWDLSELNLGNDRTKFFKIAQHVVENLVTYLQPVEGQPKFTGEKVNEDVVASLLEKYKNTDSNLTQVQLQSIFDFALRQAQAYYSLLQKFRTLPNTSLGNSNNNNNNDG